LTVCIWCNKEIPDDQIKQHIAETHIGVQFTDGQKFMATHLKPDVDPQPTQNTAPPQPKPNENPKRRYLNADEILQIIGHTNTKIPKKETIP
jgi:hypothetical protein